MAVSMTPHRWTLEEFLVAWEAGVFDKRVELIDGRVLDVTVGTWRARTTGRVVRALPNGRVEVLAGSLPSGESLPEPDCWVLRDGAEPVEQLSPRMLRWAAGDVLLVVEVSDETRDYDLGPKAELYARAGFSDYWSLTADGIFAFSEPGPAGYEFRRFHPAGSTLTVPYAPDVTLAVDDLLARKQ